jgi:hypothetical protein
VGKLLHVLVEQKKIRYTALPLPSLELVRHRESIPAGSAFIGAGAGTRNRSGWLRLRALMDIYGSIFLLICSTSFLRLMDGLVYFREFWLKPLTHNFKETCMPTPLSF